MLSCVRWILLAGCCLVCAGCWPSATAPLDEQKESNFMAGKARAQDRDYDGAIEAFERALEVNPHSASAHFELAVIHDQNKNDYAAALYHYEKARRLRPGEYPADIARDRVEVCKRELAKTVNMTPTMEYMQRELDRLMVENQRLRQAVIEWQNYYHGRSSVMPAGGSNLALNPPPVRPGSNFSAGAQGDPRSIPGRSLTLSDAPSGPSTPGPASVRTHKIVSGDNPAKIAAKYGVKLSALRAANPGMDERRLRVGQVLKIPAP